MTEFYCLIAFLLGAAIPSFLLYRKDQECRHLLNVILKKEKAATLYVADQVKSDTIPDKGEPYKYRRSRPTAINIALDVAEKEDTERYGPKLSSSIN